MTVVVGAVVVLVVDSGVAVAMAVTVFIVIACGLLRRLAIFM